MNTKIYILGAGISSLGAAYSLKRVDLHPVILEQDETYGGLCGNFSINGFRFDRFVHFSFSQNDEVNLLFALGSQSIFHHVPNSYNLYKGIWIKHPAQNNLYPLPSDEKEHIIADFKKRPLNVDASTIKNYEQWLKVQYGDYFAEHFPMVYTRKYWMEEACNLETRWIGNRLYQPSLEEVIQGSLSQNTPVTYYAKDMRYPKKGGFKAFLGALADNQDIRYGQKVVNISPEDKTIRTSAGISYTYDRLISSLPLPELVNMLPSVPDEVRVAAGKLRCTSGYQVSIGLRGNNIPPYLWWYIYDEDILPARVYAPSLKSPDNVPDGYSSLQLEVYCEKDKYTYNQLYEGSVGKLIELGILNVNDIIFTDIRFEPYVNVIFDHNIYKSRQIVRDYLASIGIETIGRFGEWDYLWSDQSLMSGMRIAL